MKALKNLMTYEQVQHLALTLALQPPYYKINVSYGLVSVKDDLKLQMSAMQVTGGWHVLLALDVEVCN